MSKKLYEKMNLYLANQEVAYIKLHNLHWYVKGRSFFTLHAKLEELYDRTAEIIDAVAERLLAVGQAPVANMKEALALATIKELADKPISSEETVQGLIADVEYWIRDTKEIVELADAAGDGVTADQFNDYLGEYQKLLWMLNPTLPETERINCNPRCHKAAGVLLCPQINFADKHFFDTSLCYIDCRQVRTL